MTIEILIQIFLYGIALSMDAFAVSVTSGLTYSDINKKRIFFIAFVFGFMQALMPLIGYWVIELARILLGEGNGDIAGNVLSIVVTWLAFISIMTIGLKMLIESILEMKKDIEDKEPKKFLIKEVLWFGFITAIDALAAGVAFNAGLSNNVTIWLHISIILMCTFSISLIGLFLGKQIMRLLKGKYEISGIIGGIILILLGIWVLLSHYLGI